MCWGPDITTFSVVQMLEEENYIYNESLQEDASKRYDVVSSFDGFGSHIIHVPQFSIDYFSEARMTYCYGFFRSSIFCSVTALDFELKRSLISVYPNDEKMIRQQTFGQSIALMKDRKAKVAFLKYADRLEWINKVRNEISVHPYRVELELKKMPLMSMDAELHNYPQAMFDTTHLKIYFTEDEKKECESKGKGVNWLDCLALKSFYETREILFSW